MGINIAFPRATLQIMEIRFVRSHEDGRYSVIPCRKGDYELEVTKDFVEYYEPKGGDFYAVYDNGKEGIIPRDVLLNLHTSLEELILKERKEGISVEPS